MTYTDYLNIVRHTIASLGHRDVPELLSAFDISEHAMSVNYSPAVMTHEAKRVHTLLCTAMETGSGPFFDDTAKAEYAKLRDRFNETL